MLVNTMSYSTKVFRSYLRDFWLMLAVLSLKKCAAQENFGRCDYQFNLYKDRTFDLISDNYPNLNNPGSACRFRFTAPVNHIVVGSCTIDIEETAYGCSGAAFFMNLDGERSVESSKDWCGYRNLRPESIFRSLVLAYESYGSVGRFSCNLSVQPQNCDCGWSVSQYIANGEEASINEYPAMVALVTRPPNTVLFCSAAIISYRYMLTAAHCALFYNLENIEAWVGRHNIASGSDTKYAAIYYINQRYVHPNYTSYPVNNDLALLQTTRNIEFSRGVAPICLPYGQEENDFVWENVDVIGWGANQFSQQTSSTLQKITVAVTDYETCQFRYQNRNEIFETQICTRDASEKSKDSCQNDSGGPVILNRNGRQYLVGVISFGKECAIDTDPIGVNSRVSSYLTWIDGVTRGAVCKNNQM